MMKLCGSAHEYIKTRSFACMKETHRLAQTDAHRYIIDTYKACLHADSLVYGHRQQCTRRHIDSETCTCTHRCTTDICKTSLCVHTHTYIHRPTLTETHTQRHTNTDLHEHIHRCSSVWRTTVEGPYLLPGWPVQWCGVVT